MMHWKKPDVKCAKISRIIHTSTCTPNLFEHNIRKKEKQNEKRFERK